MIRGRAAALALIAMGVSVPIASAPVHAARWVDGSCVDNVGITVVIDFQEIGGGVNVRCAPGPVTTGLEALDRAGITWEGTRRFPGFVCRIAGLPGPDAEACGTTPPATAFWSYWVAPRGGEWCYSTTGAANRVPPPGTVEGWSFALDRAAADIPPPSFDPPAPIAGEPPSPLKRADCGTPSSPAPAPAPATVQPAPTTLPLAPATAAPPPLPPPIAAAPDPGAATTSDAPPEAASETPTASTSAAQPAASAGGAPTTTAPGSAGTTSAPPLSTKLALPSSSETTDDPGSDATAGSAPPAGSAVALGTVDLSDDGRSSGRFSAATGLGFVLAAALGAGSIWAARRRRATP